MRLSASNAYLEHIKESLLDKHVHFQQYIHSIPVEKAEITVSIKDEDGKIFMVFNSTYPQKPIETLSNVRICDDSLDIAWTDQRGINYE